MITDLTQLQVALHQLTAFEDMLAAMRRHLEETHPPLVPLMSEGYLERIHALQTELLPTCVNALRMSRCTQKP